MTGPSLVRTARRAASVLAFVLLAVQVAQGQGQDTLPDSFEAQLAAQEAELLPDSQGSSSAGSSAPPSEGLTAYELVLSRPDLSILRLAINETGIQPLYDTLEDEPTTYLLPNNEAFRDLLRDVTKDNFEQLRNDTDFYLLKRLLGDPALRIVLSYNIFPLQVWTEAEIREGRTLVSGYGRFNVSVKTVTTQEGNDTLASPAFVDGYTSMLAQIVEPDIELVTLSVAHIVDKVMRPPYIFEDPNIHAPPSLPAPEQDDGEEGPPEPEQPEQPEQPELPPSVPDPQQPEEPKQPEQPEQPETPEQPEQPQQPDEPSQQPEEPKQPDHPSVPEHPEQPEQPEQPGKPCDDVPPSQMFTCKQQKKWGKCLAIWMVEGDYCRETCGKCIPAGPAPIPSVPNDDTPAAIPSPGQPGFTTITDVGPVSVSAADSAHRRLLVLPAGNASLEGPESASRVRAPAAAEAAAAEGGSATAAGSSPKSSNPSPTDAAAAAAAGAQGADGRDLREMRSRFSNGANARMPVGGRTRFARSDQVQGAGGLQKLGPRASRLPAGPQPVPASKASVGVQSKRARRRV